MGGITRVELGFYDHFILSLNFVLKERVSLQGFTV